MSSLEDGGTETMRRPFLCTVLLLTLAGSVTGTRADTVHVSATLGSTSTVGGDAVNSTQYLASRFSIAVPTQITGIGGHLYSLNAVGNEQLFGALLSISALTGFPSFAPDDLATNAIAAVTFDPGFASSDVLIPLSVELAPGDYALAFGSGLFSATGSGGMPTNNAGLPGVSFFAKNGNAWADFSHSPDTSIRFVVEGVTPIPEPASVWLLVCGIGTLTLILGFRQNHQA